MTNENSTLLQNLVGLVSEPVAITFCDELPTGIEHLNAPGPAGCAYWKLAAEGKIFYTIGADHLNCPIGAYTHGVELTAEAQGQLQGMIGKMVGLQYLKMEEVSEIPHLTDHHRYVVYAPLSKAKGTPDVVLIRGHAKQLMLVAEAAQARRLLAVSPIMGRPACAVIAATIQTGKATTSLGCIGNRIYAGLPDNEFYIGVPGKSLTELTGALESILTANSELEQFHRSRCVCA